MSEELSEEESLLLPYMKNQLYQKCYSVIVNFPITSVAGLRLVDVGLLTISEHRELHSMPRTTAGISLLSTLEAKGDDSMASFYRVLVSARDEADVKGILRHLEKEAKRRSMTSKDSGVSVKSPASSTGLLPAVEDSQPPISYNTEVKVDLAIKQITEVRKEVHEIKEEIREIKKELGIQQTMQQQVFEAVSNIKDQLYCIMQSLPLGQRPEPDSRSSPYHTCPTSRSNSGPESRQQGRDLIPSEAPRSRHQSLFPNLHLLADTQQQLAATLTEKLKCIAEEPMHPSTQHGAAVPPGTGTGITKNPAEHDSLSVESVKMSDEPTPDQTLRRRKLATWNPFKAISRKLSRTDPV